MVMPASYGDRLFTILHPEMDKTGSAQERQILLQRVVLVALRHSAIGVGMGNFHIYSFRELKSHNSYLEIWAELGLAGLVVYLTLIFASLGSLRRIQLETIRKHHSSNETYYLCVGLQATFAAYIVCGFFSSIQYQWYLYYPVAYTVALRRIYAFEALESRGRTSSPRSGGAAWSDNTKGLLWRSNGQRSNIAHSALCTFPSREGVTGL